MKNFKKYLIFVLSMVLTLGCFSTLTFAKDRISKSDTTRTFHFDGDTIDVGLRIDNGTKHDIKIEIELRCKDEVIGTKTYTDFTDNIEKTIHLSGKYENVDNATMTAYVDGNKVQYYGIVKD